MMVFISTTIIFAQTQVKTTGIPADVKKVEKPEKNMKTQARTDTYTCDFEDIGDFELTFTPWSALDVDGLDTYGFTSVEFPHMFEPMAFICFNPATTTPPMTDDPEIQPHSGEKFGACFAAVPDGNQGNDDWFMSTQVTLGVGASFTFWAKSYTLDYGAERFNVGVSTTGNLPEDFTIISTSPYVEAPLEWTEYTYDLSAYDGMDVYVAIQCVSYDAFVFMIDDLVIDPGEDTPDCDNFDEFMPGDYIAVVDPTHWTTWSNDPGSGEDALVTDMYSFSPMNSIVTTGSSDLVRKFGSEDLTEGTWVFSFWSYIPDGYTGYWNLQKSLTPGVEWGLQTYCWPDGIGHVDANGADAAQFNFEFDEWWFTEVIIDLNDDWCELWVEGELVVEYPWHLGTFGTGTLYTLGSANLWAWNDEGTCMHYFDDVCFYEYVTPTLCIDFEDLEDFTLDFDPWNALDVDGLETYGFTSIEFPHNFEPMAYIVFNPANTTPPMTDDPEIQPHTGDKFGACFASVPSGGQGNNDWLISPLIMLGIDSYLDFWAKSYTDDYGLERFNVGVSTTGTNPEDFTIISASPYEEAPMAWTEFYYDLSEYNNQDVYVGIQCVSYDAFIFMLDDLCVFTTATGIETNKVNNLTIYPNPAQDVVNIMAGSNIQSVTIYNNIGQIVFVSAPENNEIQINTSTFDTGLYIVNIKTESGFETKKLMIE